MLDKRGRASAALAMLLLAAFVLGCSALKKMGNNPLNEANKLVASAKDDLREVYRIDDASDDKVRELDKAEKANDAAGVKSALNDLIADIDKGLERGQSAADKIDQASKLDVEPVYKEYLSLKAQAFRKQIDAYKALREAAVIERDNFGKGGEEEKKAAQDFRTKYDSYKKLFAEAKDIHRKADDLARKNPDKIGGGS